MASPARPGAPGILETTFDVRPGEARLVGLMFAYLLAIVSTFIIGRTVRDTLFLHRVPLAELPLMYVAVAVAVSLSSYGYSRVADGMRRDRLVKRSLVGFAAIILVFYGLLNVLNGYDWPYGALYVAVEIIGALSMIQFWTLAGDLFSGRQAKRLFGFIGAGGVLANVICGFAVGALAPAIGAEQLLLVVVALFAACFALVGAAARLAEADLEAAIQRPRRRSIGVARDGEAVLHDTHLQLIAVLVVVTFATVTVVDYQFKVIARSSLLSEAELAAFFGNFYGVGGIIACLVQFFLTGKLIGRAGIIPALLVLPGMMALGVLSMGLVPVVSALFAITLAKGAENIFRYTVNDATFQLLYVPVSAARRGRAKAFIDGILKPCSIGFAGLALWRASRSWDPEGLAIHLAWIAAGLLVVWAAVILRMKKAYLRSLIGSLHDRRSNFEGAWAPAVDEETVRMVRGRLRSEDATQILHALELVPRLDVDLHDEVEALLDHPSGEIRVAALEILGRRRRFESISAVRARLEDPMPEIRVAAVEAMCAIGRERAIRVVEPLLQDQDLRVRGAVCAALILHSGLDGILTAADALKGLLDGHTPEARREGLEVLTRIEVKSFFHPVLARLDDADPRVRLAAIEAAGAMQSPELVPALIYRLSDRVCGRAAGRALARFGASVEPTLFAVLANRREALEVRRRVPAVLGLIGGERALSALVAVLETRDPELRALAAREAARIRERAPRASIEESTLDGVIERELRSAYQTLATLEDLELPQSDLLVDALQARFDERLRVVSRLLEVRYPGPAMRLVHANLGSESRTLRANAIEVADNILGREEARRLLPLLDEGSRAVKVRKGAELFELRRMSSKDWLPLLLKDPHPWTVACTLLVVAERGHRHLETQARSLAAHVDPVVRETALVTLGAIASPDPAETDDLERLARKAAVDPAREVRVAADVLLARIGRARPRALGAS